MYAVRKEPTATRAHPVVQTGNAELGTAQAIHAWVRLQTPNPALGDCAGESATRRLRSASIELQLLNRSRQTPRPNCATARYRRQNQK